ncbi:unnamed protein product [Mytilus edulis]|uniref:Uncharacterized protein n=1 Tax=Mytilus edulis TaxID=6550 RepID=A0A8S3Q654_MYTED|nr:unnamed protein product [Mytilus edulis]
MSPNDPENGQHQPYGNAQVYGREYELGPSYKPSGWSESMNNKEVPCAVCLKKQRSNILVIPVQGNTCSGDSKCDDIVTMPLLDGLKATLKADLDVSNMNDHLKTYIASEIKKGFENAMNDVMKQIVNKGIEEINATITAAIQESLAGQVGGNDHINKGGGVNYLCLPNDPENGQHQSYSNDQVYGGEYELSSSSKPLGWSESMHDKEVPCAVCYKQRGSAVLIVPGRKTCYEGWNSEYHGYLMSDHYTHNKRICLS